MIEIDERFFEYDDFGRPLDANHRQLRANLRKMMQLSSAEFFAFLVEIGIYNPDGTLTEHYADNGEPSKHRPTD
jgi:hypothetical protein